MTGRKNLLGLEQRFILKSRHCQISSIFDAIYGTKDQLVMNIPLDPKNNGGDAETPIEFMLCRLSDVEKVR